MFAYLDLNWKPSTAVTEPPAGKAPGIVRGDTFAHTIRITDGWVDNMQANTFAAQLRRARLTGATAGDAVASFSVVETQDDDDLLVTIGLTSTQTSSRPNDRFWDMQATQGSTITTLLTGKVKVFDDVTRAA